MKFRFDVMKEQEGANWDTYVLCAVCERLEGMIGLQEEILLELRAARGEREKLFLFGHGAGGAGGPAPVDAVSKTYIVSGRKPDGLSHYVGTFTAASEEEARAAGLSRAKQMGLDQPLLAAPVGGPYTVKTEG